MYTDAWQNSKNICRSFKMIKSHILCLLFPSFLRLMECLQTLRNELCADYLHFWYEKYSGIEKLYVWLIATCVSPEQLNNNNLSIVNFIKGLRPTKKGLMIYFWVLTHHLRSIALNNWIFTEYEHDWNVLSRIIAEADALATNVVIVAELIRDKEPLQILTLLPTGRFWTDKWKGGKHKSLFPE